MLAASPELWWLQLSDWLPFDHGAALASEVSGIQIQPIVLPLLTSIILHTIPAAVTQFLLSSISAPSCQCVIVREVPPALLNHGPARATFPDLINSALKAIPRLRISCRKARAPLHLLSEPPRNISYGWIHRVDELPGVNVQILQDRLSARELGDFLSSLDFPDEVKVTTNVKGLSWEQSLLHVPWHRVLRLEVPNFLAAATICEQLANLPEPSARHSRLQLFRSQLTSYPEVHDSIIQNVGTYVKQRCARKDAGQHPSEGSDNELNRRNLEIQLPRTVAQKLRRQLGDWDVRLSDLGRGWGLNVDEDTLGAST
ncbi:hypothetical protein FRC01_007386 [Tulasnella sp. 417]|nr:hypothetical protein FRC01_007386 [Tulasnella sp. 417]